MAKNINALSKKCSFKKNTVQEPVLNMIRFPDRDPTGFCTTEPDPDWTGF